MSTLKLRSDICKRMMLSMQTAKLMLYCAIFGIESILFLYVRDFVFMTASSDGILALTGSLTNILHKDFLPVVQSKHALNLEQDI